jgi:hypothetical protein
VEEEGRGECFFFKYVRMAMAVCVIVSSRSTKARIAEMNNQGRLVIIFTLEGRPLPIVPPPIKLVNIIEQIGQITRINIKQQVLPQLVDEPRKLCVSPNLKHFALV